MTNEMQMFNSEEFGNIRATEISGEPWFVGKDVALALGFKDTVNALKTHVHEDDRKGWRITTPSRGEQEMTVVNESGLYALIFGSKLDSAQRFKRWVTHEVLPSIRKHGLYAAPATVDEILTNPDTFIKLLQEIKAEREKSAELSLQNARQAQIIHELKPKADYTDKILQNRGLVTITQIAKDYGMSGEAMNALLHELGIQYKQSDQWLLYAKYQSKGYTHSHTIDITRSDGSPDVKMNTKWTQKGRLFLYDTLRRHGTLPMIERSDF